MDFDLPELTEEEQAEIEGVSLDEPDESPEPAEEPLAAEEEVVEDSAEAEEGEEGEESPFEKELEELKRANAGLLNDLRRTRAEARADRTKLQSIYENMEKLAEAHKVEPKDEDPEPDREEDAIAWLAWRQRQDIKTELSPLKEKADEEENLKKIQEIGNQVRTATTESERMYLESSNVPNEEYNARLDDLRLAFSKEFMRQGMSSSDAINETAKQEHLFAMQCLQDGLNPAEEAMRLWEEVKPPRAPWHEKSAPEKPAEATEKPKTGLSKVEAARAGQKTSGVGSMSGSGGRTEVTLDMLADMDPDDPIAVAIYSNEKKFAEININGKTTV